MSAEVVAFDRDRAKWRALAVRHVVDALGRASIEEMTADGDWLVVLVPLTPHQYLRRTPELRGLKVPSTHSTLVQFQEQAGDISGRAVVVVMFERGGAQLVKMKRTS